MKEKIIEKLLSGRFIFTVIVAVVFAHLSITGKFSTDKVIEVTLVVLYAYFSRNDRKPEQPK